MSQVSRRVRIANDLGVHLRAAGALVQVAGRYAADIWLDRNEARANAKSIMSVLSLAAGKGTELVVGAQGEDAQAAVDAIVALIERGFELS